MKNVVVSLSGGMDSSTLLLRCLKEYDTVTAISFDYGQKHRIELERAQQLVDYVNHIALSQVGLDALKPGTFTRKSLEPITYQVIKLAGLSQLLNSALVEGGDEVPEGHYAEDNMKATVVPNRNKIFASIVQAVALSIANRNYPWHQSPFGKCDIALGIHAGDHAIYPDCRQEFRDADDAAFRIGNWDADKVNYFTPYLEGDKFTILQDGEKLCEELGLDFDEVYKRTNTSYKPIPLKVHDPESFEPTGEIKWFSDYKSASSVERVEAFIKLGRPDPVGYANEGGSVGWDTVVKEVTKVLEEHNG